MTETTNTPAAAADPVAVAPVSTPVAQPADSNLLSRVRAWFSAAVDKVKAAAAAPATPQAQPAAGPDLVDTAPPPVAAPGKARAWLSAAWAWLVRKPALLGVLVLLALLIAAGALWPRLAPVQSSLPPEQTAAVAQTVNPLAELVARIEALEAQVAELQDPPQPWPQTTARQPSRSATAQRPAATSANPAIQPQQPAAAWGQTDLDRAISNFTPPTTFGASK